MAYSFSRRIETKRNKIDNLNYEDLSDHRLEMISFVHVFDLGCEVKNGYAVV